MGSEPASVIGIVAAYRRPEKLANLLSSLNGEKALSKIIVVDNGFDSETESVCLRSPVPTVYHRPGSNLGCGGGVARGLALGLKEQGTTHFCLFDDDSEATPGAVNALIEGMKVANAQLAVPLVVNSEGFIGWPPGLQDSKPWSVIRQPRLTPGEYRKQCGSAPVAFSWAPWPTLAISASLVRECGFPREDFWFSVEDLEYTLRMTYKHRGVLVPDAVCRHLPPESSGGDEIGGAHYLRFCLLLQNLSYICTRLPHARRALKHLPGNYVRFLRTFGVNASTIRDSAAAWWRGGIYGKPAGAPGYDGFKERFSGNARRGS